MVVLGGGEVGNPSYNELMLHICTKKYLHGKKNASVSSPLWVIGRYRLKHCVKGAYYSHNNQPTKKSKI